MQIPADLRDVVDPVLEAGGEVRTAAVCREARRRCSSRDREQRRN